MTVLMTSKTEMLPCRKGGLSFLMRAIRSCWFPSLLAFSTVVLATGLLIMETYLSLVGFLLAIVLVLDARARYLSFRLYSNDKRVINTLRILTNCRSSFCSRQVAVAIYGNFARKFYREYGYKWYHVLPDGTFSRKSPFLKKDFWWSVVTPTRWE